MGKFFWAFCLGAVANFVVIGLMLTWDLKKTRSWPEYLKVLASWPSVLKGRKW